MQTSNQQPPKLADRLLRSFAGSAYMEDLLGDLAEAYSIDRTHKGKFKADLTYWYHVLSLIFSYGLRKRKKNASYSSYFASNSFAMFGNYFKIAIRNFSKQKLFTSINIVGLALGMSICLLALSIAVAIYRSDDFHERKDRIYQINTTIADESQDKNYASTFHATGTFLKENFPFVEEVVDIRADFNPTIDQNGNEVSFRGYFAGEAFFKTFSFELISGDPYSALQKPYSVVITEKTAQKLFRDENPIGKTLKTDFGTFNITGVMQDLKQTHLFFEILASYKTFREMEASDLNNDWLNYRNNYAYVLLQEGSEQDQLTLALSETEKRASTFNPTKKIELKSVELTQVVPRWNVSNAIGIGWDQPSIIFFLTIGLLVLLPAVFNYTNLSIARALKRTKEIGIRKVVGADKMQIKAQFLVETVLMAMLALGVSLLLMMPMKTEFLSMLYAAQVLDTDLNVYQVLTFLVFSIIVGILAGIFPALYFSRLNPIQTLKGEVINGKNSVSGYKKGLFVFQFFLSLVFIIGVVAIGKQYSYVLNNNHGFESDNVLSVSFNGIDKSVAMNELGNHADIKEITASSNLPGLSISDQVQITSNDLDSIDVLQVFVADDFVKNMKMELTWGEFEAIPQSNQSEELVLVNQEFMRALKVFNTQKDTLRFTLANGTNCRVVGILHDFNFEPLSELISPLLMRYSLDESNFALLTVNSPNIKRTLVELEQIWHGIDQEASFQTSFLVDEIEDSYYFLTVQIKFFSVLSILAITISCLGLLGMVSYTTENRTKEIAIRKIMGATNSGLYMLLTRDFVKLILISSAIAIPFSYFFYDKLFLHFLIRYGTGLGVIEVVISILFLFLVGFASIFWQTSRVAKMNPARNLRYE